MNECETGEAHDRDERSESPADQPEGMRELRTGLEGQLAGTALGRSEEPRRIFLRAHPNHRSLSVEEILRADEPGCDGVRGLDRFRENRNDFCHFGIRPTVRSELESRVEIPSTRPVEDQDTYLPGQLPDRLLIVQSHKTLHLLDGEQGTQDLAPNSLSRDLGSGEGMHDENTLSVPGLQVKRGGWVEEWQARSPAGLLPDYRERP